jgi:hypothetical protein
MTTTPAVRFHAPTRPYSPIDALNRRAAATGSPRYGQLTSHADYNGHSVSVYFNDYRQYYVADYTWSGRQVLGRGEFATCLEAALFEYGRGALGGSVSVSVRADDAEAIALCEASPLLVPGVEASRPVWYTWRHEVAASCAQDAAVRTPKMLFDWSLLESAESREAYEAALKAKHGRVYNF